MACAALLVGIVVGVMGTVTSSQPSIRYAKDLPPPAPLPKVTPGHHLAGYSVNSVPTVPTTAPSSSPAGLQTYPTAPANASRQQKDAIYLAQLQQQGTGTAEVVRQYVTASWCGPLHEGGTNQGNPVPPDPTQGLSKASVAWTGAEALGPVKERFCVAGYASKDFYFNGAPFGPRIGSNGLTSEPVAIELSYQAPSGADYHVFFIDDVTARVTATERSIVGAKLEAMWVGNDPATTPAFVTSPANFTIPPDAVISAAISTRQPLPTSPTHIVRRPESHPPLTVPRRPSG